MLQHRHQVRRRTFFGCWWVRVFALLLFVYGVNYVPVHLVLETHLGRLPGTLPGTSQTADAPATVWFGPGHEDASHHPPHLASDHSLRMTSQAQVNYVAVTFCVASTAVKASRSTFQLPLFLTERQNPPGLPPPDPLQPRAPPLA